MNSNLEFDYGAFIDFEFEQKRKIEQGIITPSFFTFTFTKAGTHIFNTASSKSQLMIIIVKGVGEKCADPDRYLEVMSGESLAHQGVSHRKDLIIHPNIALQLSMFIITLTGTGLIMIMASYCANQPFAIKNIEKENYDYRESQIGINIHHKNKQIHHDLNDFVNYKSELINDEDEDCENINFDIQQDLVDAGKKYLNIYKKKKQRIRRKKNN